MSLHAIEYGIYLTRGRVFPSSSHDASLYLRTSAIYRDHASFGFSTSSSSRFCFFTIPVGSTRPPRRLPTIPVAIPRLGTAAPCRGTTSCLTLVLVSGALGSEEGVSTASGSVLLWASCIFLNISKKLPSFWNTFFNFSCSELAAAFSAKSSLAASSAPYWAASLSSRPPLSSPWYLELPPP